MKKLALDIHCITIDFQTGPDHFFTSLDNEHVEKIEAAAKQLQASGANEISFPFNSGVFVDTLFIESVMHRHGVELEDLDESYFKSSVAMDAVELVVNSAGIYFRATPLNRNAQFLHRTGLIHNQVLSQCGSKLNLLTI